ncbi:MAG: hypothetical protein Q9174_000897 [Haloplaca sp. 1 TL-2023]
MSIKRSRQTFEADLQAQQSPHVIYGTPLPPLDPQTRDDGSYVPVWKQEVTDERGRKRLHGAFTGGFSAGYYNTVGSKEGWTPSTFVSSRRDKKVSGEPATNAPQQQQQRPEDFMDEEDIADAEEAKKLQTSDTFAGFGSIADEAAKNNDDLMGIFKPTGETMGLKLLKKMGWREGQGIGPKVRRKARTEEDDDPGGGDTHLFAPDDSKVISLVKKTDRKGLGFHGEGHLNHYDSPLNARKDGGDHEDGDIGSRGTNGKAKVKKKSEVRGGFGVGILNDDGSGDEDPYSMGPKISYNRIVGGEKKIKKANVVKPSANPLLNNKPVFISKKTDSSKLSSFGISRCHDGRLPLDGFVLASKPNVIVDDVEYPPPTVPENWKSTKTPLSADNRSSSTSYQSTADVAKASTLSPRSRAALLGETALPGKSVFDYLTPSARSRIATATNNDKLPAALSEAPIHPSTPKSLHSLVPPLAPDIALTALGRGTAGWMPYAEDLTKRGRYRLFLEVCGGLKEAGVLPEKAQGMSRDDWVKEMQEFAHAAEIFKPMTGMMATRFTSSSSTPRLASDAPDKAGNREDGGGEVLRKPSEKAQDPRAEAARLGMYGPLTREAKEFYPTRLLCKRFNIRPPAHVQVDPGQDVPTNAVFQDFERDKASHSQALPQRRLELVGRRDMDDMMRERNLNGGPVEASGNAGGGVGGGTMQESEKVTERAVIDPERNEALEKERPGDEVFRAIFGSDSEDE